MTKQKQIIDFSLPNEGKQWEAITDRVMGGVSQGQMVITSDKTAIFRGVLSLENYGGFASVRTHPQNYQLDGYEGLSLRVKGDGKRYRIRLKTDDHFDSIAYQAGFTTKPEEWIVIQVPFNEFIPVFRGQVISNAPKLELGGIRRIGFMIADKQEGPFRLEIDWVKAYSEDR